MFSLEFFKLQKRVSNTYENVPYVEYEIQRRVLTRNVDKRPSTVNIYIYSGHIIHIEYVLKLVKIMSCEESQTIVDICRYIP